MKSERGFTLIEALIAFAILAVVLVALYEVMGTSLKGFDRAAETDRALMIAQSELDRLSAMKALPAEALQGAVEGTPFRWRATVVPDAQPEPEHLRVSSLRLQKLRLVVSWGKREIAVEKALLLQRAPGG
ncbi:MAG: type II secretion system protein [Alphaproteobacteria bacterium]|jgi:type II secretion system protein I|nr:type II secretion system protein [Alphaproteobacteria bacterium]